LGLSFDHEATSLARSGTGQEAPNPAEEVVQFRVASMNLRYGVGSRMNLRATLPYLEIASDKVQGEFYQRQNSGFGDLVVSLEYAITTNPQITVEAGLELPTGNIDETDGFGQRICDILALGSGTTDPILGAAIWIPRVGFDRLDVVGSVRHRFSGGQNKYGYQFGDLTVGSAHGSFKISNAIRAGVRAEGFHSQEDSWYGNSVPERGATMVQLGPTASWTLSGAFTVGGYAKTPIYMDLEGAQMVSDWVFGMEITSNLTNLWNGIFQGGEEMP
jgi:hypothetical protein